MTRTLFLLALSITTLAAPRLRAQDAIPSAATGPCRAQSCRLTIDWGPGLSTASFPVDRRYGAASDFEDRLSSFLAELGVRTGMSGATTILARPRTGKAMCDAMPGTNTSYDCTAIMDIMINVAPADSNLKPISLRLLNRCGGEGQMRSMKVFAEFVAENLDIALDQSGRKRKAKSRC